MQSDKGDVIQLQIDGKIAIVTLNLPQKLNALSQSLYHQLSRTLRSIAARNDIFITVLTGSGRYFSAGADLSSALKQDRDDYETHLKSFVAYNLEITNAFYTHPKILVTALNGPVIGLSAALISFSDFVYAAPHTFLLTPFTSLGLVTEGGASIGFVQRLGISKANEALIMSKKISCAELEQTGFVNKVFHTRPEQSLEFLDLVLQEVRGQLGDHLESESLLKVKALIRKPQRAELDQQTVAEVFGGLERLMAGVPQREFDKVARGQKKHKL